MARYSKYRMTGHSRSPKNAYKAKDTWNNYKKFTN